MSSEFRVEEHEYPAGGLYRQVFSGKLLVGHYDVRSEGFLPSGTRKVLGDERDAQFRVIQRYISKQIGLAAQAARLYDQI